MTKRGMALLTAVLMLWVAAIPAFAADVPYPDVSADHWAYEAIASLHNAGLVEGYPDGTFGGERTFTRYEMAMVFNRILQRLDGRMELLAGTGIDVDALMDEFGSELDLINALTVAIANAQRTADTAAERAYRARLAAVEALAQVQEVEHTATMALALAQEGGGSGDDDARTAAQRAQRVAADAEAAALRATAIAESAFTAVKNVEQAAGSARTTGDAEGALDQVERVTDLVMQADRLAYLAQLNADRALELAEGVNARFDELVKFGGEVKAAYEKWGDDPDPTLNVDLKLNATAQVSDDVKFAGGVELKQDVLADAADELNKNKLYANVITPGFLREVSFATEYSAADQRTNDFVLTVGHPIAILDMEFDIGFERELDGGANAFRNWRQIGFSDADILGFGMDFHYYMDDRDLGETTAIRAHAGRTLEVGLPLKLGLTVATVEATEVTDNLMHYSVGVGVEDYALSDMLTVNAGVKYAKNPFDDWEKRDTWRDEAQELTFTVGAGLDVLGGKVDAEVEFGSLDSDKLEGSVDFSYPLADGMDTSVGVAFDKDDTAVKAGLGVKF